MGKLFKISQKTLNLPTGYDPLCPQCNLIEIPNNPAPIPILPPRGNLLVEIVNGMDDEVVQVIAEDCYVFRLPNFFSWLSPKCPFKGHYDEDIFHDLRSEEHTSELQSPC